MQSLEAATGRVLKEYGIEANLCPEIFTSEGLANALTAVAKARRDFIVPFFNWFACAYRDSGKSRITSERYSDL